LRYAERVGGSWFLSLVDGNDDSGWDLSLAVDSLNRVQIAYYARVRSELRYAIRTSTGWVKETVDTGGVVGWYTGLALNGSGFPHLSYFDWTNGDLKYAEGAIALEVRTLHPFRITSTSANLQAEVVSLGDHSLADIRFAIKEAGSMNWTYLPLNSTSTPGPFSAEIANLTTGVRYEYRAEARAGNETALGEVVSFLAPAPSSQPSYATILAAVIIGGGIGIVALMWYGFRKRRRRN
jgi:hypothetical protein